MRKPLKPLNAEDRELLVDLVLNSDGIGVLLDELERQAASLEADVLRLNLDSDSDRRLLVTHARSEGARRLVLGFRKALDNIRVAALDAKKHHND